jgi:hypothetical protein
MIEDRDGESSLFFPLKKPSNFVDDVQTFAPVLGKFFSWFLYVILVLPFLGVFTTLRQIGPPSLSGRQAGHLLVTGRQATKNTLPY